MTGTVKVALFITEGFAAGLMWVAVDGFAHAFERFMNQFEARRIEARYPGGTGRTS